jgi:hypothetical protein
MLRIVPVLAVAAVLALAGCRSAPLHNPTDIAFPEPAASSMPTLTLEDYKNAIIRAGAKRGWFFEEEAPGHLIGNVTVRGKHFATVDVLFDTEEFSIKYRDSRNLDYDPSTGRIHTNYNSWVTNLQKDIQAEIVQMEAS